MTLYDLLNGVAYETIAGSDISVTHITIDSRTVSAQSLFMCIRGLHSDGHDYIDSAIESGATSIVCEQLPVQMPTHVTFIKVSDSRQALARIAANFYGMPANELTMLGVTGTNGKTSITYFTESVLRHWGRRTGVIGTSGARIADEALAIPYATATTPDTIELHHILQVMRDGGADSVVMEVTSHALALQKAVGIPFQIGMFINLTQDHLDFHGTMDDYLAEKAKLFQMCETGVFNADDAYAARIMQAATCRCVTFGIDSNCDYKAENVALSHAGVQYDVCIKGEMIHITAPVPGRFTVYNTLCTVAAMAELGAPAEAILAGIAAVTVPGRIQSVPNDKGLGVIVDYSHTPDGVSNIITAVRGFTTGKVITVLGCGGDRDKTKRPIMGEIAGQLSDYVFLTSDNPRSEHPEAILADMEPGIAKTSCPYEKEPDRRKAIHDAIRRARPGDNIILAGKGSEDYQEFENKRREPFDDIKVAAAALEAIK